MATVTDYESSEEMKKDMEWVYTKTKFHSRLDNEPREEMKKDMVWVYKKKNFALV